MSISTRMGVLVAVPASFLSVAVCNYVFSSCVQTVLKPVVIHGYETWSVSRKDVFMLNTWGAGIA
jgi:hypothetical protein